MDRASFARGARVKPKEEQPLTLNEVTFVMCSVAEREGIRTEAGFLELMRAAWTTYRRVSVSAGDANG